MFIVGKVGRRTCPLEEHFAPTPKTSHRTSHQSISSSSPSSYDHCHHPLNRRPVHRSSFLPSLVSSLQPLCHCSLHPSIPSFHPIPPSPLSSRIPISHPINHHPNNPHPITPAHRSSTLPSLSPHVTDLCTRSTLGGWGVGWGWGRLGVPPSPHPPFSPSPSSSSSPLSRLGCTDLNGSREGR